MPRRPAAQHAILSNRKPYALRVCTSTYLSMALVKMADARMADPMADKAVTAEMYSLAGDALYVAAEASKSPASATSHRADGEALYDKARAMLLDLEMVYADEVTEGVY